MSLGDYLESEMQTQEVKMKLNSIQNSNSTSLLDMTIQDLSETHQQINQKVGIFAEKYRWQHDGKGPAFI